nr:hydroxyacylglutathione hydrolase [Methylococcales bacterium]
QLPGSTRIYCAHEYTQANGNFALTIEPGNRELLERMEEVRRMRLKDLSTVPSMLSEEWATNPFLRLDSPELRRTLAIDSANPVEVFAEIRRRKDHFS